MKRKLSKAEEEYIRNHHENMTADELCSDMHGVGAATVQSFIETNVVPVSTKNESQEERHAKMNDTGLKAGDLMGRDPERGVVVMTEGASELSDARRVVRVPSADASARKQSDRIFLIDPNKKVR